MDKLLLPDVISILKARMASRTAIHHAAPLLRSGITRQSVQKSKSFRSRSLHYNANTTRSSRRSFLNGYTAVGVATGITVSSLALYLHHNGVHMQLLANAKADEPVTPHTALDETPIHCEHATTYSRCQSDSSLTFFSGTVF